MLGNIKTCVKIFVFVIYSEHIEFMNVLHVYKIVSLWFHVYLIVNVKINR